ncbi:methane monooxygenase/ammonia monooxygenase subunit A [Smaragdicoccus niigatensis]|uniref:methane monooxygenase/ammonia monooxygenase subunit A n=1 Tax=Smaragdicoccus niigatensis TaxID=359359 RepID=UPI00037D32A3|nr:methane monooxygenase/ammonia monooxygenase subunit A [Smaragdicoccus niigatensis]
MTNGVTEVRNTDAVVKAWEAIPRHWKWVLLVGVLGIVTAAVHLESMLMAGDWSFWADWKDRQWWPLLTPPVNLVFTAVVQYILWTKLRLPIGATVGATLLVVGQWISRVSSFHFWADLPLNFTWPETLIFGAIIMDCILLLSRSLIMTSIFGSLAWGGLFWWENYPMLSAYLQPLIYHDHLMTMADYLKFSLPMSQGPEYLRMVEEGHLRALVSDTVAIVGFFSAMVCVGAYWFGVFLGKMLGLVPAGKFLKLQSD